MRKSRHCGTRKPLYEENPDRRIHCPEWSLDERHYETLSHIAKLHNMSRSRVFETVIQNFIIVEKPTIDIQKAPTPHAQKKTLKKLTLHPTIIELIKMFSLSSGASSSLYINEVFDIYFSKYKHEVELKKIIDGM
jgi:hypothetical protein